MLFEMIRIRECDLSDTEIIGSHRRSMFYDMGHTNPAILDPMIERFRPWLRERLASGEYRAWFIEDDQRNIVAGAGLWLMPWPPHLVAPDKPRANIVNVYTQPVHRRMGLARDLMKSVLKWCQESNICVVILHASDEGRSLYESLGFRMTNEMRLDILRD
jgi:GNAT superfamily N-acetyltransferase